jgi:hypothetical protein
MKVFAKIACLSMTLFALACSEREAPLTSPGKVEFSFIQKSKSGGRIESNAHSILITIMNSSGEIVQDRKTLSLYTFGNEFISEPISVVPGNYQITEFLILDSTGNVLYVTPLQGSELAYLVDEPLPISFEAQSNQTTKVSPEVVAVEDNLPADFGYAAFSFNVIETFMFATSAFAYSEVTNNIELTSARIVISDSVSEATVFSNELSESVNLIRMRDGDFYHIEISKLGYETYGRTFSSEELKAFTAESPLTVVLQEATSTNGAILLDGIDDFIELGNIYDNVQLPVSISCWVWVDPATTSQSPIFVSQDADGLYKGFWFIVNPSHVFAGFGDGLGGNAPDYRRDFSGVHDSNMFGQWRSVVAVIKGKNDIKVYLDGSSLSGVNTGYSDSPMNSNFSNAMARIGTWTSNGNTYKYHGVIDELRIWNYALSEAEATQLPYQNITGNETGLIGYWDFNESDGNTVVDKSPNHYDGTVYGNAARVSSGIPILQ